MKPIRIEQTTDPYDRGDVLLTLPDHFVYHAYKENGKQKIVLKSRDFYKKLGTKASPHPA